MLNIINLFAQAGSEISGSDYYNMSTQQSLTSDEAAAVGTAAVALSIGFLIFVVIMTIAIMVPYIIAWWKLFKKAGEPGWASIVPVYNSIVMTKIAGLPIWYAILTLVPGVGFVFSILILMELSKKYSQPATVWLAAFIPIIALFMINKTEYIGGGGQGFAAPQAGQSMAQPQNMATQPTEQSPVQPQSNVGSDNQNQQPPQQPPFVQ